MHYTHTNTPPQTDVRLCPAAIMAKIEMHPLPDSQAVRRSAIPMTLVLSEVS